MSIASAPFHGCFGTGGIAAGATIFTDLYERFNPPFVNEPGLLEINRASHLTQGLVFLAYPGGQRWHELVGGGLATWSGTTGGWYTTGGNSDQHGISHYAYGKSTTSSDKAYYPWNESIGTITDKFTMMLWGSISTFGGSASNLFNVPYRNDGTWTTPWISMSLARATTTSSLNLMYASTGSLVIATSDTGLLAADSVIHLYGGTRNGADVIFYKDNVQHGAAKTFATNTSVDFNGGKPPTLGNRTPTSNGESTAGTFIMAAIWNRALTAQEWAEIYLRPFILVKPRRF